VTGIDIAAPMITAARQRITAPEIDWIVGDAATYDFPARTYDAVISRFGVMFFTDPPAAFRNLSEATRPGGRLIVTVWSPLYATGLFGIPYTVATTTLHRLGAEYQGFPPDGILFSLGRPETIREVLNAAGWADIETAVDNRTLYLGSDPTAASKMTMAAGPVQALLEGQPETVRAEVEAALTADYTHRQNESGIGLPAGFIVVAARRP
jgi:ubiquinone/menaquinone biosynthesis C-methylase UbiE